MSLGAPGGASAVGPGEGGFAGGVGFGGPGTPGFDGGRGGRSTHSNIDTIIDLTPFVNFVNFAMRGVSKVVTGEMTSLGREARGDPLSGQGVSGPDSYGGVGGGPSDTLTKIAAELPTILPKPVEPPIVEPPAPIGQADLRRKRIGRQETIAAGALGEPSVFKPTLLGE